MSGTPASQEKHVKTPVGKIWNLCSMDKCSPDENNADFLLGKEKDNKDKMKILSASSPSEKGS